MYMDIDKGEFAKALDRYFLYEPPYSKVTRGNRTKIMPRDLPTFEGFSHNMGITMTAYFNFIKSYPELSDLHERCQAYQKHILSVNLANGLYDSKSAIFLAKNLTDYRDSVDQSITISSGPKIDLKRLSREELDMWESLAEKASITEAEVVEDEKLAIQGAVGDTAGEEPSVSP